MVDVSQKADDLIVTASAVETYTNKRRGFNFNRIKYVRATLLRVVNVGQVLQMTRFCGRGIRLPKGT